MKLSDPVMWLQLGNISLILCCVFYLIWWSIAFHPTKTYSSPPKFILLCITLLFGALGLFLLVRGIFETPRERGSISNWVIVGICVVLYFVLLLLTYFLLHRQVTTELFLIVAWTMLEVCVSNSLYRASVLSGPVAIIHIVVIVIAATIGMLCYLAYYNLEDMKAFYDGMVPLILCGVVMIFQTIWTGCAYAS